MGKLSDIAKSFYILSFLFLFFFYILPVILVYDRTTFFLSNEFFVTTSKLLFLLTALFIFVLGFIFFDVLTSLYPKKNHNTLHLTSTIKSQTVNYYFWLGLLIYVLYILYKVIFVDSAAMTYKIRSGEAESNLFNFFIGNVMEAIKISIILSLLITRKHKALACFMLFVVISSFILSSGRLSLILNIVVLFFIFWNVKSTLISSSMFVGVLVALPVILVMKSIIYDISMNGTLDFSNIKLVIDWDIYLMNFGHPLFSFLNVDVLISNVGYRYFWDYIQGFLFYLKLIGLDFGDSITYFNTESLLGIRASVIPPGYFTLGYAQLGLIGVFFSGLTYRFMGKLGEILYNRLFYVKNSLAEFYIAFLCANSFYHGDIRIFVMTVFFPFFFCYFFYKIALNNND